MFRSICTKRYACFLAPAHACCYFRLPQPHLSSAVDALRVGEHQLELLGELHQPAAGVAGGADQDPGVPLLGVRVLVINVAARHRRVVVLQLDLVAQLGLLPAELRGDGLALCVGGRQAPSGRC